MNFYKGTVFTILLWSTTLGLSAQSSKEGEIKAMEELEREAILRQDTIVMDRLWDKDLAVNSPTNNVVDKGGGMYALRNKLIHYSAYEKQIDKIIFYGDIGVVMGLETVKPIGLALDVGKTVKRRFTNIWRKAGKSWTLVARQATNISVE